MIFGKIPFFPHCTLMLFSQKFRESKVFTKEGSNELIWRKKIYDREFLVFPHFALTTHRGKM